MAGWLRLRQICLVAHDLEAGRERFERVFGWQVCHRDPNVGKYGLANVLFAVGNDFLEIVAPTSPGTAAGRFLERHGGRDGYMVIVDCDDPDGRAARAADMGVRTANRIEYPDYLGVQLHPADTGAAMLEFNRTRGGERPDGPYAPAGAHWRGVPGAREGIVSVRLESPSAGTLARRWAALLDRAPVATGGAWRVVLDTGDIEFASSAAEMPALRGVTLALEDVDGARRRAGDTGCLAGDGCIDLCGVRISLTSAGGARA